MKNILITMFSCIMVAIITLIGLTIHGRAMRQTELENAMSFSMKKVVSLLDETKNTVPKTDEELSSLFIETLSVQIESASDLTVNILEADVKKGILSAEAILTYKHPIGTEGNVTCQKTILLEQYQEPGEIIAYAVGHSNAETATSYTNAKEFYVSTGNADGVHAEIYNGSIYRGTKAKAASTSSSLKYRTIGYDITLFGNGESISFQVKRGGTLEDIHKQEENGYIYNLYCICWESIKKLVESVDNVAAKKILGAKQIQIRMDDIMTTVSGNTPNGTIEEDGSGGLLKEGVIYHLKNEDDLNAMRAIFTRHTFDGYYNVNLEMKNYSLIVKYQLDGGSVSGTFTNKNNILYKSGSVYTETGTIYENIHLLSITEIGLQKEGYHLESGKEWIYENKVFSQDMNYSTKFLEENIGVSDNDIEIYLKPNWKPNSYIVRYHANGGVGEMTDSSFYYDNKGFLKENIFTRTGYKLVEEAQWNTKVDVSGMNYKSGQEIINLTAKDNSVVNLYAMWKPETYTIKTYKNGGFNGTDSFFQCYDVGFIDGNDTKITRIEPPNRVGYTFSGYYEDYNGQGTRITDSTGKILVDANYFTSDAVIVADWLQNEYTITFDKNDGADGIGTEQVKVLYGEMCPFATAPIKTGYSFKGYYLDREGVSEQYYTENMSPIKLFELDKDVTLYAKWVDNVRPLTTIRVSSEEWNNHADGIKVEASAWDFGEGLDYAHLYCDDTLVATQNELNGSKSVSLDYTHKQEGVFRYRIIAYDVNGNYHESYANVQYDKKAPSGNYTISNPSLTNFCISVHANDYNIQ